MGGEDKEKWLYWIRCSGKISNSQINGFTWPGIDVMVVDRVFTSTETPGRMLAMGGIGVGGRNLLVDSPNVPASMSATFSNKSNILVFPDLLLDFSRQFQDAGSVSEDEVMD